MSDDSWWAFYTGYMVFAVVVSVMLTVLCIYWIIRDEVRDRRKR